MGGADGYSIDALIASFELGIKLGTLYHQFTGIPIKPDKIGLIERAIESSIMSQPYVKSVSVRIDKSRALGRVNRFGYIEITGDLINASITVEYGGYRVRGGLMYDVEHGYPYMRLIDVEASRD